MIRRFVLAALVAAVAPLAGAAAGRAAPAGELCKTFETAGLKVQWETAGTGWTCSSAKPWVVKLIDDHVRPALGSVPLRNGPHGYHCFAVSEKNGHVSGGLCYLGTLAYPKSGFTWNGN
jgi:hypothetical protein